MSKYLDKAIKEMRNYGDMGLPDGENGGGMGSKNPVVNAYKMNNILRRRQAAEEEEMNIDQGMRDAEMPDDEEMDMGAEDAGMEMDMDMGGEEEMGMGDEVDTEEMKAFFQDNEAPSDEEVQQYADERGIDMEQMRQEVYALIQSLLGDSDPVGDGEEDMGMDAMDDEADMGDEIEFSAPMDGGEEVRDEEEEAKAPAEHERMKKVGRLANQYDNIKSRKREKQFFDRISRSETGKPIQGKYPPAKR